MTATYSQIRDALIQLSLKTNTYLIEDDDKLLFIAEEKPLVIKNKKDDFSKTEIESLLKSFKNISLKVDKLKETMHDDIENRTNEDSFKDIIINGEKITLTNQPIIENGILQLPIEEVTNKLGFKVENKKSKLILTKDEIVFEYEVGTKNIKMNDTLRILSTKSQVKNKVIYGEMAFLLREMGYILKYDDFKDTVEIRNK
ncbi:copper amine oxidase N-terminal domain-containing protein [Terrisporobacter petrolearius]|uniref:stalk domain-containing protein n=1 Tax=Terrisporobacter petrolearius TaxID=1460447 RepID=UPI001D16D604|nr:stalk domain-containing protein [Terrisporobacter petrolearius]MCC3866441.1 copper amine oxidase N-terminal domain-containing protein [Terrisporobacter petrolearius]